MLKRTFKITKAEVGSWSTSFSIKDMDHENSSNSMAPEAFFHHLGALCGKNLDHIQGLTFEVILPSGKKSIKDDPLSLCGQTIVGKSSEVGKK